MYDTYIAKEDDTIEKIAAKYNLKPEILKVINNSVTKINEGTKILIPRLNQKYFDYYLVTVGNELSKIATDNNMDANLLAILNGLNKSDYIYPNEVLLIPKAGSLLYVTTLGDTLEDIASSLGIDTAKLLSQNNKIYLQPEQLIVYKY